MQGNAAEVGKFYLPPRVKQPLEVVGFLRGKDGAGPITEVTIKNLVTGNEMNLPADYELGEEVAADAVNDLVAAAKATGTAAKAASKAKKEPKVKTTTPKAASPVETADAGSPAEATQAAPAAASNEDNVKKTEKKEKKVKAPAKAKTAGELRGRPKAGAPTRSGLIDKMLATGKHTCAQIVDAVMKDSSLKVPKDDAKKIRTLVSVRISRAQVAGGKYLRDKMTKVVKVEFAEKKVKAPKAPKPKKEKKAKAA